MFNNVKSFELYLMYEPMVVPNKNVCMLKTKKLIILKILN